MKTNFFAFFITPFMCTCASDSAKTPEKISLPDAVAADTVTTTTSVDVSDPFADSLKVYLEHPLDFYSLKRKTLHMHSGYSKAFREEYAHSTDDPDAEFYCYWAVEFDMKQHPIGRSLVFATWKPWKTKQQRSYENDNETLIGIESRIAWDGLQGSNFVGLSMDSIKTRFGSPISSRNNSQVYYMTDKVLILHENESKIDWFRYYWMDKQIEHTDSLPQELFVW